MTVFNILFGEHYSLRRSLIINIIIALSICIGLAMVVLIHEFYQHLEENIEDALYEETKEIIGQIDPTLDTYGLDQNAKRFNGVHGLYRYTVFDAVGATIIGGETSPEIQSQMLALKLGRPMKISLLGERLGVGLRAKIDNRDFLVLASTYPKGTEKTKYQKLIYEIKEEIIWVALGILMILAAAIFATRRALSPLTSIQEQAQLIGPTATTKQLSTERLPAELVPLITSVNGAFERLEKGYQAQRDFSSNVAHEIRTPLAVLRSSIDRIDNPEVKETIREDVLRLDRMFEQMIDLSRADALAQTTHEPLDLHQLVVDLAIDMSADALKDGKSLAVIGAANCIVVGNKGAITVAIGNLVRNALIYSPIDTEVEIEVTVNPPSIRVLDRGDGISDAQKQTLFERFQRGAASNDNVSGSGIGLAIVKSVADAHNASIEIHDRQGGGSIFELIFQSGNKS